MLDECEHGGDFRVLVAELRTLGEYRFDCISVGVIVRYHDAAVGCVSQLDRRVEADALFPEKGSEIAVEFREKAPGMEFDLSECVSAGSKPNRSSRRPECVSAAAVCEMEAVSPPPFAPESDRLHPPSGAGEADGTPAAGIGPVPCAIISLLSIFRLPKCSASCMPPMPPEDGLHGVTRSGVRPVKGSSRPMGQHFPALWGNARFRSTRNGVGRRAGKRQTPSVRGESFRDSS